MDLNNNKITEVKKNIDNLIKTKSAKKDGKGVSEVFNYTISVLLDKVNDNLILKNK